MPFFSEGRGGTGGGRGNRRLPARSSPRAPRRLRSARGALGPHWPGAVRAAQWCVGGAASAASVAEATASGVSNRPPPIRLHRRRRTPAMPGPRDRGAPARSSNAFPWRGVGPERRGRLPPVPALNR